MNDILPYIILVVIACLINIPFGYIRENHAKFSLPWIFWIHASIPLLICFRMAFDISIIFIPVSIFFAILGQIIGSRYRRRQMTTEDVETLEQIPDLQIKASHQPVTEKDILVTVLNMGGPQTTQDVRPFLMRIFNDPIILRFPMAKLLQPFFAWLMVTFRSKATEERYQLIGGGSPIYDSTERQTQALRSELLNRGRNLDVCYSFNYSEPLPETTVKQAKSTGKKYLLLLSLYSHYSKSTTGSNIYYLKQAVQKFYPDLKLLIANPFYLHEGYIQAFVDRITEQLKAGESLSNFYLVFSAHGTPLYFLTEGDPYAYLVNQTVARILEKLNRTAEWVVCYQSAVGPMQWLKPSTESVLAALSRRGKKKILIVPVSFVSDHIETTCEIDIEYRKVAEDLGITDFRMSKAIESHPGFIKALADSVETSLPKLANQNSVKINHDSNFSSVLSKEAT